MLTRARTWMAASRCRRWTTALLGATALAGGVALIVAACLGPKAPDPATASDAEVAAFFTDGYDRLGPADREAFLRGIADRALHMSPDERRDFNRRWKDTGIDRDARQRIQAQINLAMARRLAEAYERTPPEARAAFLDRILFMLAATGKGGQEFMAWLDSNPMDKAMRDPSAFLSKSSQLQREIVLGTNAEERASLSQLGGDLLKRARERYGR